MICFSLEKSFGSLVAQLNVLGCISVPCYVNNLTTGSSWLRAACLRISSAIAFNLLGNARRRSVATLGKAVASGRTFSQLRRLAPPPLCPALTDTDLPSNYGAVRSRARRISKTGFWPENPLCWLHITCGDLYWGAHEILNSRRKWVEACFKQQCMSLWDVMQLETFRWNATDSKLGTTRLSQYQRFVIAPAFHQPVRSH